MSSQQKLLSLKSDTVCSNQLKIDPGSLLDTAKDLTDQLNSLSEVIQKLEDGLQVLNANFPYKELIMQEARSIEKTIEERHKSINCNSGFYTTRNEWLFSWEMDDESKKYRLFLIKVEKEFVYVDWDANVQEREFSEKVLYRRPLRQTKIAERLQFSKYLDSFICGFESYLASYQKKELEL